MIGSRLGLPIFTLWVFVFSVGLFGLVATYARPKINAEWKDSQGARLIDIELVSDHFSPVLAQEHFPEIPNALELPPQTPVFERLELIEPVGTAILEEGSAEQEDRQRAVVVSREANSAGGDITEKSSITTLTYGQGNGKQPLAVYPFAAIRERQEGKVVIVFTVDAHGGISHVELEESSGWPLLDQSALSTVKNRFSFPSGIGDRYKIRFTFEL